MKPGQWPPGLDREDSSSVIASLSVVLRFKSTAKPVPADASFSSRCSPFNPRFQVRLVGGLSLPYICMHAAVKTPPLIAVTTSQWQ